MARTSIGLAAPDKDLNACTPAIPTNDALSTAVDPVLDVSAMTTEDAPVAAPPTKDEPVPTAPLEAAHASALERCR